MKSVHNGKLRQVSASQIQKFDPSQQGGCNRRWYFDKVLGLSEPTTKSQATGTSIHGEIEHYLKTGENVLGKVALAGLQFIPQPKEIDCLKIEVDLADCEIADVPLTGRIDLLNISPQWIDEAGEYQYHGYESIEVVDWKTTSNLTYAKTGEELLQTAQMVIYGYHSSLDHSSLLRSVRLSHVYFQTRGAARAKKSTALFSIDKIRERYNAIEQVVEAMKQAAQLTDVRELPANLDACMSFGRRCTYWDNCPRAQQDIFDLYFGPTTGEENMAGLFDKPLAKKTTQETHKNGTTTMPLQELALMPDAKAQLLAEEEHARKAFGIPSIVPPDARPSEGPGTYEPEPVKGNANQTALDLPQGFTKPTKPAEPKEAVFNITKAEQVQVEAATPTPSTLELFVNTYVRGAEVQDLQVIINKCVQEIETQYGVVDIRLGKEPLAYGGWKGVLAAKLRDYNLSGRWAVNGTGDFIAVAIESLERQASFVVKGV